MKFCILNWWKKEKWMIGACYIVCSIQNRWKSDVVKVMWIKNEKREQIAEIIRKFYNEWICMFGVPISNQFDIWYYFYTSFDHWNKFVRYSFQWSMDNTMLWRHSRIGFSFFFIICSFVLILRWNSIRHSRFFENASFSTIRRHHRREQNNIHTTCVKWLMPVVFIELLFLKVWCNWMKIIWRFFHWKMIISIAQCRYVCRIRTIPNQNNEPWLDEIFGASIWIEHTDFISM